MTRKTWDDTTFKDAQLKKGQRKPTYKTVVIPENVVELKKCRACGKPFLVTIEDHCKCSPWEVR